MKTCFFGGTFDPPHIGHLIVAEYIMEWGDFDKVIFIPSYKPPHKLENISSVIDIVKVIPLISINFGLLSSLSCLYEIIDNSDKLYLPALSSIFFSSVAMSLSSYQLSKFFFKGTKILW